MWPPAETEPQRRIGLGRACGPQAVFAPDPAGKALDHLPGRGASRCAWLLGFAAGRLTKLIDIFQESMMISP